MGLSILTAFLFHRWQQSPSDLQAPGKSALASENSIVDQMADAFAPSNRSGEIRPDVESSSFDDPKSCAPERLLLQTEIEKFPPLFREERTRAPADFPRKCLISIMKRKAMAPVATADRGFATCSSLGSVPILGSKGPCITEAYVNVLYNLYGDVTSCLGLPQREMLPRVLSGSGFHMNWMGPGLQIGLARLTEPMIGAANAKFQVYKDRVLESEAESCKRLRPYVKDLEKFTWQSGLPGAGACALLMPPANPLLNLFYMAIHFEATSRDIIALNEQYQIRELLTAAGLRDFEPEQLQQTLVTIALSAGSVPAVLTLKNYLQARLELYHRKEIGRLTREDFDFGRVPVAKSVREVASEQSPHFGFPAYLAQNLAPEARADLEALVQETKVLNSIFKEGTCVAESYLSLSL